MANSKGSVLGDWIRKQRTLQELSMRQMARMSGISNPYLSQIERGLRVPSERVLEAIATTLDTSAEAIREEVGISKSIGTAESSAVVEAVKSDSRLNPAQRRAMLELYKAFTE